ncbi:MULTISPECIES: DUF6153 family protein [unclassified Streptomyces]|uniref:DUF6153 family protein n=1 Tax=unclassified Streptomyces TaxID=2593676 RepID=UPI002E2825F6|nr:DUF6153 family protein [Streptomyces sp. NBC_01429]
MRRPPHGEARTSWVRVLPPLVLAVVAGLLAMHGLAPATAPLPHPAAGAALAHDAAAGAPRCAEPDHRDGGHAEHADATCAATGTSGGPVLPSALTPGPLPDTDRAAATGPGAPAGRGDRAPPSLSRLQLLRI